MLSFDGNCFFDLFSFFIFFLVGCENLLNRLVTVARLTMVSLRAVEMNTETKG